MSTTSQAARITGVTGGSEGLAAIYVRVLALATTYDAAGNRMRDWAGLGGRIMRDGDLLESSVLAPLTFGEAEAAVLCATTGPDGVLVESVGWETDAILIRVTVRAFEETDDLVHSTFEALDHLAGRAIGFTLATSAPVLIAAGLTLGALSLALWPQLPPRIRGDLQEGAAGAGAALETWLTEHPEVLQHLVNAGGGLLDGLADPMTPLTPGGPFGVTSLTPDTESAAGLLAALYGDDGTGVAGARDLSVASSGTQPAALADVIAHLGELSELSGPDHPENNGTIEIQTLTDADGQIRHIVYLPGTDDMTTLPWTQDGDVRDMATNLLLIGGHDNAYQQGILDAMDRAGIGPDDPVLIAGHSQGGMEAAAILGEGGGGYHVTNVVTAGSPTAQVDGFPPGTHVLSLEHRGDVIPLLDGEDNPDSAQQVTVLFDDEGTGIADNHSFPHYVQGAVAVDASQDPSIQENLQSMQDNGFLGGSTTVESQVFQITRQP